MLHRAHENRGAAYIVQHNVVCVSKSCLLGERVRDGWYFLLAAKLRRAIRTMTHYKIPIVNKEKENTSANAFVLRMRLAAQRTNQSGGNVSTSA